MRKLVAIAILSLLSAAVWAQKASIGFVYPCGAQRGSTLEVQIGGQNIANIKEVTVSGTGITAEIIPDKEAAAKQKKAMQTKWDIGEEDNLQLRQRLRVKLTIDKNAAPGMRDLRVRTNAGLSNRLFFEVGTLRDFYEKEQNRFEPNDIGALPCVINGQVMRSDIDCYEFSATKGQRLVIDCHGRAFVPFIADAVPGWFQPQMALYDESGREVAFCDDYFYHIDPVILFDVPATGRYRLEVRDALFRGREDFVYRIAIGELPFITSVFPMGGSDSRPTKVELRGVNLPSTTMTVKPPKKNAPQRMELSVPGSNAVAFELCRANELFTNKAKPNISPETAIPIALGDVVNGCITKPFEYDWYYIDIKDKQPLNFEIVARRLGSPLDARLLFLNSEGRVMDDADDADDPGDGMSTHHADPVMIRANDKPGRYLLRVGDAQSKGGPEYSYRLKVSTPVPDFELGINPATITIPRGGTALVNLAASRRNGFKGDIDLEYKLPPGYKVVGTAIRRGDSRMLASITAPENATEGLIDLKITGKAKAADGTVVAREAQPVEEMIQAFYISHFIPAEEFRVEVTPLQPFWLEVVAQNQPVRMVAGGTVDLRVRVHRRDNYAEQVMVQVRPGRGGLKAQAVAADPGQDEVILKLECPKQWRPKMIVPTVVMGTVKGKTVQGKVSQAARQNVSASVVAIAPVFDVMLPEQAPANLRKQQ